ncbi:TonB-dependent receptor [Paradesertivirga mongoliensis]|uniref:TonB-dependent receptor n=1 Tax=Paradesertivirga mongoliensis TaxID=2100740 RepID=A0ABW4ZL85_9SPHI|nr:TonB-dependent receptor [Pedobacter mongoliensis]
MKSTYFRYTFFFLMSGSLAGFAQTPSAQGRPIQKDTITEEIEVVRPYRPVLADASKIRRSPNLNNNKPFRPNLNYSITDKRLELNSDLRQLQAEELIQPPPSLLENNYAKLGAGNLGTVLGEVYINTGADPALQAGGYLKHINQSGDFNKQQYSRQELGIFGKSIRDKITLNGELGYDRFSTFFYGIQPDNSSANPDPGTQRFGTLSLKGELLKNFEESSESDYGAKLDAYFLGNKYDAKENSFTLSGFFNKVWRDFNVGANSSIDFTGTKDAGYDLSNNLIRINPYLKLQGKNYKLSLGINLVKEFGTSSRTNLFPTVIGELPIVPGYATIFGGYTGDVLKSTLRSFAATNPYLAPNVQILNAVEKSNVYGGIKGNAGAGFGFKAMVFYKSVEDMPLFTHNAEAFQKFDVIYDEGTSKNFGFEGELSVRASETLFLTGRLLMNEYKMASQQEAWYKPNFRLFSNARLSLNKKFILDAELVLNGDSNGLTYVQGTDPLEQEVITVKSYVDLSAGAEYQFKQKFGAFLRVNNLFGNEYQRYLYYPNLGLNILGGLNYSF